MHGLETIKRNNQEAYLQAVDVFIQSLSRWLDPSSLDALREESPGHYQRLIAAVRQAAERSKRSEVRLRITRSTPVHNARPLRSRSLAG